MRAREFAKYNPHMREQDTVSGLQTGTGSAVTTGAGAPDIKPPETTFTDMAKSWDKFGQDNPMTRTAMGFIPGVAQVAGAADVASAAIQGNMAGAIRNLPGVATGATQKQLQAGMAAYDAAKQGNMANTARSTVNLAAAGGNPAAAGVSKAISAAQTASTIPKIVAPFQKTSTNTFTTPNG